MLARLISALALLALPASGPGGERAREPKPRVCLADIRGQYGLLGVARDVLPDGSLSEIRYSWVGGSETLSFQTYWSGDSIGVPDTASVRLFLMGISRRVREFASMEIRRGDTPNSGVMGEAIWQAGASPRHVTHEIGWSNLRALASDGHVTVVAVGESHRELSRGTIDLAMFGEPARLAPAARTALDAKLRDPAHNCRVLEPGGEIVIT